MRSPDLDSSSNLRGFKRCVKLRNYCPDREGFCVREAAFVLICNMVFSGRVVYKIHLGTYFTSNQIFGLDCRFFALN